MRVQDLIELLQMHSPEAEVHFSYNYGDHWRTQVAPEVTEVYEGKVEYSEYHRMPKLVDEDYDDYDDEEEAVQEEEQPSLVVILG